MPREIAREWGGAVLSLARVVLGFLFMTHGASSLLGLFGGHRGEGGTVPFMIWPSWWAGLIQLVGGALVMVGLGTRVAAVICSGSMAYAYFVSHQPEGALPLQNGGEPAALFCWMFLLIAALGPGPYALDALIRRRGVERRPAGEPATQG